MPRPFVCGTLGRPAPAKAARLVEAFAPAVMRLRVSTPTLSLWSSSPLPTLRREGRVHFTWGELCSGPAQDGRWRSVAESLLAAGVEIGPEEVVLHTDSLGLNPVYTSTHGSTLLFSNRLNPLAKVIDGPLHPDEDAWNTILAFGAPIGAATTFQEVRRLEAGCALVQQRDTLSMHRTDPSWLDAEVDETLRASDLVAAVTEALPEVRSWQRTSIPLSGGWDSRILAIQASVARHRRSPRTVTTSGEGMAAWDPIYAAPVASALGFWHESIEGAGDQWPTHAERAWQQTEHQTWLHAWLNPLAEWLCDRGGTVVDGLAGDALIKGSHYVTPEGLRSRHPAQAVADTLIATRLGTSRLLAKERHEWALSSAHSAMKPTVERFAGHHQAPLLVVCFTRMARCIARAPIDLLSPDCAVRTPFLAPGVLTTALQMPFTRRAGYALMREVLDATARPDIGRMLSTNDADASRSPGPQLRAGAAAWLADKVLADESVTAMLSSGFVRALQDPEERWRLMHFGRSSSTLQWAATRADWNSTHAGRLADT